MTKQLNLLGEVDGDEEIIQKYEIHKYFNRGTKGFQNLLNHYKYVEEHNERVRKNGSINIVI